MSWATCCALCCTICPYVNEEHLLVWLPICVGVTSLDAMLHMGAHGMLGNVVAPLYDDITFYAGLL